MKKSVRYPGGHAKPTYTKPATVKNRKKANLGKELEGYLDATHAAYIMRGQASIFRQSPEVTVVRKGKDIISAFHKEKAGLDYIGLSGGQAFTFDAKETEIETSFPLKNIEPHQVDSMKQYTAQGGLAFLLIRFKAQQKIYFVTLQQFAGWWELSLKGGRKSIPYEWIEKNCRVVGSGGGLAVDYLPFIKKPIAR